MGVSTRAGLAVNEHQMAMDVARQIEHDFNIDDIVQGLWELPDAIRRQREAVRACRNLVRQATEEVEFAEAILTQQIASETDPRTGKPVFSNDGARKAELVKRKATDPEYTAAAKKLAEAEAALDTAQYDEAQLLDRFSSIRSLAGLTRERLRIIGGVD